jgi:hypothetical protein
MATSSTAQKVKDILLQSWGAIANINFTFKTTECCTSPTGCAGPFRPGIDNYMKIKLVRANTWRTTGVFFGMGPAKPRSGEFGYCDPTADFDADTVPAATDCDDNNGMVGAKSQCENRFQGCALGDEGMAGALIHEVGHGLGIAHEQQNPTMPDSVYDWCNWLGLPGAVVQQGSFDQNGRFGTTYQVDNGNGTTTAKTNQGFAITDWDPLSAVTYCPDTDGIFNYNGGGIVWNEDDELADLRDTTIIGPSDIAGMELIYGVKGAPISFGGKLHVSSGFQLSGQFEEWVAMPGGTITAQWRNAGVLDSMFGNEPPRAWTISQANLGSGLFIAVPNLANSSITPNFRFTDFRGRTRTASQPILVSPSRHAGLVTALML